MSEKSDYKPITGVSLSGEKIMLVGGMGFIGHHLALTLKNTGAKVLMLITFR